MKHLKGTKSHTFFVIRFSLPFAYLLSFQFEGKVLYNLLEYNSLYSHGYIFATILAHFAGLFSCGWLVKTPIGARNMMLGGMGVCLIATSPFFFSPSPLWAVALIVSGYAGGCYMAVWGYYLKKFVPKEQRFKACADMLICSNVIMIVIYVVTVRVSTFAGLALSTLSLLLGMVFIWTFPDGNKTTWTEITENSRPGGAKKPLLMLCLFVFVITINSGLMYQVINPAFGHLAELTSWYWAVPYITLILILRNLPIKANRSRYLYIGLVMLMASFIGFMLLGRGTGDYLFINTLILGACGIFDLFWWSILGGMLDYSENPVKVFGVGLSANVFGVLFGGILGFTATLLELSIAEITVIALTVLCITLLLLPSLNRHLLLLLKSHAYLTVYDRMNEPQKANVLQKVKAIEELTVREKEVLGHILSGKSNREIAQVLEISESTVKTHAGNIFAKYDVSSRAELISTLLKNQVGT